MKTKIDIDESVFDKLQIISEEENISLDQLLQLAIRNFVDYKEREAFSSLNNEEKEDLGLLALMNQAKKEGIGEESDFFEALHKK